jgi:cyclic beta-1,2-glucan synthetase
MGSGDWCDGYNEVGAMGKGESVWLSMFYVITARNFARTARLYGDFEFSETLEARAVALIKAVDTHAYDDNRGYYIRGFYDDGRELGSGNNDCCKIDLLPQAFAALADFPDEKRVFNALNNAVTSLYDEQNGIVRLFSPPFSRGKTRQKPGYVMSYPEGVRENGGQYTHAAVWFVCALHAAGQHDLADKITLELAPFNRNSSYKNEPYYLSADIYTNPSCYGRGGWSLYTGSAGWYLQLLTDNNL